MQEEIRKKSGYVVVRAAGVFDVDANTSVEDLMESLGIVIPEVSFPVKVRRPILQRYSRKLHYNLQGL